MFIVVRVRACNTELRPRFQPARSHLLFPVFRVLYVPSVAALRWALVWPIVEHTSRFLLLISKAVSAAKYLRAATGIYLLRTDAQESAWCVQGRPFSKPSTGVAQLPPGPRWV